MKVKPKYTVHILTLDNILLRSALFTKQSFAMENKFLSKSFSHKLEVNLMQNLQFAHSCMPSPLAPDPNRVHVFVVYSEPIEIA